MGSGVIELQSKLLLFEEETKAIISQMDFMEESIILSAVRDNSNEYLRGIIPSFNSIEDAQSNLEAVVNALENRLDILKYEYSNRDYKEIPDKYINIDQRSEMGEFIALILEHISNGETDKNKIAENIRPDLEALCIIKGDLYYGECFVNMYDDEKSLLEVIDVCINIHDNNEIYNIEKSIDLTEYYIKLFEWINIKNSINIYRQSFIQLIAMFDTIVFECYKIKFNNDFFEGLKYFKEGSIKYSELANYQDFETFKNDTIESKLRNCYLKDLLNIARNKNKNLFMVDGIDNYTQFREMINCRNCHIHNNGIVDNAYMGVNNNESFNIFNYNLGDYLGIDKKYFQRTYNMCKTFLYNFVNEDEQ